MKNQLCHNPVADALRTPTVRALGTLLLRIAFAAVFMTHGYAKLAHPESLVGFFGMIGIPSPAFMVPFVGFFEFFGGLAVLLGFATRFFASTHVVIMLVAIFGAKGISQFGKIEIDVMLLAAALSFIANGPGKWSVDEHLCDECQKMES